MIKTIKHKGLKLFYEKGDRRKLPADMVDKIDLIMMALDAAIDITEMDLPSFRLHALSGRRKGSFSVTVRSNWRIIFSFENGNAYDVDYLDYH